MLNHFHFLDNARDGRRPLTFSRYAGPGSHRYPVGFTGDTVISWASLAFQPYFTATASNIGYGWWSHDIGGHMFGGKDDELATRWLQLGVFSPILRLHSGANPFTAKEPWTFEPAARAVMTEHLRLRHRLVPYLHTMNHRAAAEGRPLVEPMYHAWPSSAEAYDQPNQFLFGSELVVAPLTSPADLRTRLASVRAWLPAGTWVDVFTGLVYDGGRELLLHRDLSTIPVLAPAGAIVPLDGAEVPGNDPVNPSALEVLVVVGADGAFTLVEDDGTAAGVASHPAVVLAGRGHVHRGTRGRRAGLPARHPVVDRDVPVVRRLTVGRRRRRHADAHRRSRLGHGRRRPGRRHAHRRRRSGPAAVGERRRRAPVRPARPRADQLRPQDAHPPDRDVRRPPDGPRLPPAVARSSTRPLATAVGELLLARS